jgi:hypothetical protein
MMGKVKKEAVKVTDSFVATLVRPLNSDKHNAQETDKPSGNSEERTK